MRHLILALAAGLLGLALTTGSAQAGGFQGGYQGYYKVHGKCFKGGYYYRGRHHCHWGHRCWCPTYKRYKYWDCGLRCYYSWCPKRCCYYPCGF